MAISKDNVVFVYNANSSDSLEVAQYYAAYRGLDTTSTPDPTNTGTINGIDWVVNGQLIGIYITDSSEILPSESSFNLQVLDPLKDALENSAEILSRSVWCIILGYSIPGGFLSGTNIISSTSRISRIFSSFSKKVLNKLYDRSIFSRFNSSDAEICLICSRIDSYSVVSAKSIIDNSRSLSEKLFVDGTFFIDPYSDKVGTSADEYKDKIVDFYENHLPLLNLDIWSTTYMDPYIDSNIPYVQGDSFVWSWFTSRGSNSFFKTTTSPRVFFYNADYDGAYTVKAENNRRWPSLALSNGYCCTAGSMSNPSFGGFLNPSAFFNSLLRGGTVGESFLFSTPYLDWTVSLFGDPLLTCSFPSESIVEEDSINEHEAWNLISQDLSRSVAEFYKRWKEMEEVQSIILDLTSESGEDIVSLTYAINDLMKLSNYTALQSVFQSSINSLIDYPVQKYRNSSSINQSYTIDTYLSEHEFKLSSLITDAVGVTSSISSDNLLDEGWWRFEFNMEDQALNFVNYHFILDVASDEDFNNIILSKNSYYMTNWTYEKSKDVFDIIPISGVPTSHIGRKIRYDSRIDDLIGVDEYLTRGETYYFRVTQYNAETGERYVSSNPSSENIRYSDIIYS